MSFERLTSLRPSSLGASYHHINCLVVVLIIMKNSVDMSTVLKDQKDQVKNNIIHPRKLNARGHRHTQCCQDLSRVLNSLQSLSFKSF